MTELLDAVVYKFLLQLAHLSLPFVPLLPPETHSHLFPLCTVCEKFEPSFSTLLIFLSRLIPLSGPSQSGCFHFAALLLRPAGISLKEWEAGVVKSYQVQSSFKRP